MERVHDKECLLFQERMLRKSNLTISGLLWMELSWAKRSLRPGHGGFLRALTLVTCAPSLHLPFLLLKKLLLPVWLLPSRGSGLFREAISTPLAGGQPYFPPRSPVNISVIFDPLSFFFLRFKKFLNLFNREREHKTSWGSRRGRSSLQQSKELDAGLVPRSPGS